jgi:hypothetical protein
VAYNIKKRRQVDYRTHLADTRIIAPCKLGDLTVLNSSQQAEYLTLGDDLSHAANMIAIVVHQDFADVEGRYVWRSGKETQCEI